MKKIKIRKKIGGRNGYFFTKEYTESEGPNFKVVS